VKIEELEVRSQNPGGKKKNNHYDLLASTNDLPGKNFANYTHIACSVNRPRLENS
jgi:hypothetical protein